MAQARLGYMYMVGLGLNQDNVKAYAWLKLAADSKNKEATKELKVLVTKLSELDKLNAEKFEQDYKAKGKKNADNN